MKKMIFALLALAMPIFIHAQIDVITYDPYHNGPYNVLMHGHVNNIDDLAVYDSVAVKCYYRLAGAGPFMETETLIATRDHGNHFEIPAFDLTVGEDYECQFSASVNYGPEVLGDIEEFTMYAIAASEPETETYYAEHIGNTTATLVGFVEEFSAYETANGYFRYGEDPASLDLVTPLQNVSDPFGQFEVDIKGLTPGKIISFQACATNPSGESCGDVVHFLTPNKGVIDVEDLSIYQEDDCEVTFDFGVDIGDRPLPAPVTFKIGNPGGTTYTKEFWYQGFGSDGITMTSEMLAGAGIDPYDPVIITLTVSSYGEVGKTGGTTIINYYDCDELAGGGDDFRFSGDNGLSIFPNPAIDNVTVKNDQQGQLTVFGITGKLITKYSVDPGITEIDISSLTPGTYLFRFVGEGKTFTQKIVKQ